MHTYEVFIYNYFLLKHLLLIIDLQKVGKSHFNLITFHILDLSHIQHSYVLLQICQPRFYILI